MKEQGWEQLTLFPEDSHANLFPSPGNEAAKTMTVTSGRKCLELYGNSSPLGSLVRMCLGSSIWHSTRCLLTWRPKTTKAKRLLFQLAVSTPRTDDTELPFWPTPKASATLGGCSGARKTLDRMAKVRLITEEERRSLSAGNGGKTNPQLLEWLMGYEQEFTKLIPTPRASDYKGAPIKRYWVPGSHSIQVERERERVSVATGRVSGMHSPWQDWPDEPDLDRVVDGLPDRMDRLKCLGNAVVPQQFYPFFAAIVAVENNKDEL